MSTAAAMRDAVGVERFETEGPTETEAVGAGVGLRLRCGDVVALDGALGAGKTCFVRGLARGLGHDAGVVSSPTFVVVQEYDTPGARCVLVHADGYRLDTDGEADEVIGLLGLDAGGGHDPVIAVEWSERSAGVVADARVKVSIAHAGGDRRAIVVCWCDVV